MGMVGILLLCLVLGFLAGYLNNDSRHSWLFAVIGPVASLFYITGELDGIEHPPDALDGIAYIWAYSTVFVLFIPAAIFGFLLGKLVEKRLRDKNPRK